MFSGNNPDDDFNTVSLEGFLTPGCTATPCIPANQRRPFFAGGIVPNVLGVGGNFGWTGRVQAYFNEAHNWYKAMQARFTRRFSEGWSAQVNYTLQKATNYDDDYWIYDPDLNKGPADFDRTHNFTAAVLYELPWGRGKKHGTDWSGVTEAVLGGWQLNTNLFILSGTPFDVSYRNAGEDRDTGTGGLSDRPDLIGDHRRPTDPRPVVQCDANWFTGQRIRPSSQGDVRQSGAQRFTWAWILAGGHVALQELLRWGPAAGWRSASNQ